MKHLKTLGLFVMAAASLAFAGSASAATFTSPTGTAYTGTFDATLEGSSLFEAGFANITCTGTAIHGTLTTNNDTHAALDITQVKHEQCGSATFDTLNNNGTLTIAKSTTAVTGTGTEVTTSMFGTSCVYGFGGTPTALGTASNTVTSGVDKVTLKISAKLPKISGGFLCASPASWTASFIVTTPTTSYVH
jgi:hypothetical protein